MLTEQQLKEIEERVKRLDTYEECAGDRLSLRADIPALIRDFRICQRALENAAFMAYDIAVPFNEADAGDYLEQAKWELVKEGVIKSEPDTV